MKTGLAEPNVAVRAQRSAPVPVLPAPVELREWARALTAAAAHFRRLAEVSEGVVAPLGANSPAGEDVCDPI